MSNTDSATVASGNDDLADLGLNLETGNETVDGTAVVDAGDGVKEGETEAEKKTRKAVNIGNVTTATEDEELPDIRRGGGGGERGSKYDFSDLNAPTSKGVVDGVEKFGYFTKTYEPGEGTEVEELDRSVKSAVAQANKAHKEAGEPNRYSTRAVLKDGKHTGTKVFRVDGTTSIK